MRYNTPRRKQIQCQAMRKNEQRDARSKRQIRIKDDGEIDRSKEGGIFGMRRARETGMMQRIIIGVDDPTADVVEWTRDIIPECLEI